MSTVETSVRQSSLIEGFFKLAHPETRRLVTVGREHGWDFKVMGQAPMPEAPIRLADWVIVPATQDSSQIPDQAMEKLEAIFTAGLRPKGFVVVHEAPKLLPASDQGEGLADTPEEAPEGDPSQLPTFSMEGVKRGLKIAGGVLAVVALLVTAAAAVALVVVAIAAVAAALLIPAAVVGSLAVDPILIAVTDDDYWIEIDRWDV